MATTQNVPRINRKTLIGGSGGLIAGLLIWQFVALTQPVLLATPRETLEALLITVRDGSLAAATAQTLQVFGLGLLIAILIGVPVGMLYARSRKIQRAGLWLVFAIQAIPIVALAPVVSAALGVGLASKVFVVVLISVFPILLNTMEGAGAVPKHFLDVAHVSRSKELQTWRDVILPYTLPYAMTGIRQGIAMALVGALVGEFFLSVSGLGGILLAASSRFDIATTFAVTLYLAVIAVALIGIGRVLERVAAPWNA